MRADPRKAGWHRVFHPLCGADLPTLLRLAARSGPLPPGGGARLAVAAACALLRAPFTVAEQAVSAIAPPRPAPAPVFIVGHPRSGTTHLHNLLAASGAFSTVPPVHAGMPWEPRGLARLMNPLIAPYLPETRIIDAMKVTAESPTEDEVALANLCDLSYFHALYFPRRLRESWARGLFYDGAPEPALARRHRRLAAWVDAMTAVRGGRPLLLKNPAYTAQIGRLHALWPAARVIHIHRDPFDVFASTRRMMRTVTRELGLQPADPAEIDAAILETWPRMIHAALDAAEAAPGRVAHVAYERLDRDPLGEAARLWEALGLPGRDGALAGVSAYLAALPPHERSPHVLGPAERAAVAERSAGAAARLAALDGRRAA